MHLGEICCCILTRWIGWIKSSSDLCDDKRARTRVTLQSPQGRPAVIYIRPIDPLQHKFNSHQLLTQDYELACCQGETAIVYIEDAAHALHFTYKINWTFSYLILCDATENRVEELELVLWVIFTVGNMGNWLLIHSHKEEQFNQATLNPVNLTLVFEWAPLWHFGEKAFKIMYHSDHY